MLLWHIFWVYTRVALFSWGGGPASLALMQRETTTAFWLPPGGTAPVPWMSPEEFADAVAVGNALPGPVAPQVSACVGYKLAGVPGAVAAAAGTVVPTTLLMLIMVAYFFHVKDSPNIAAALKVVRPLVVGLLLWTAYDMAFSVFGAGKNGWGSALTIGWDKIIFVLAAFVLLTFTRTNPALIIFGGALIGGLLYR
ncbi:chromate transporter [Oryzomonas japonica]|uniref:Chromate transporter n=1 Tax=Oryzomonas japonica TaxID=2603858 RepID=A0A7J4ZTA8_9BACT|nr:chromate transporter [Oryzomonas japonica]KAB0666583.1 chromate transporter [Oryzomonas japonica]